MALVGSGFCYGSERLPTVPALAGWAQSLSHTNTTFVPETEEWQFLACPTTPFWLIDLSFTCITCVGLTWGAIHSLTAPWLNNQSLFFTGSSQHSTWMYSSSTVFGILWQEEVEE
jgi:hypothetical protein